MRVDPRIRRLWLLAPGSARAYMVLAGVTLTEGVALAAGGPGRASAPSWAWIYTLGGPGWFGAGMAVLGAGLLVAPLLSAAVLRAALLLAAIGHFAFAFAFAAAAATDPRGSWLAVVIWAGIAVHLVSHREAYREVAAR